MSDENDDAKLVPILKGEAPQDRFGFKTEHGEQADPSPAIFPIIKWGLGLDSQIDLLATGFFIGPNIFVTARHVIEAAFDHRTGQQAFSVGMIHFYDPGKYLIRPILRGMSHRVADVTVGVVAPMTRDSDGAPLENKRLVINKSSVGLDAHVMTYAYPRYQNIRSESGQIMKLLPAYYDGRIIEHLPNGRDRVLLPGPCYRTSIAIHHGASGGPVFSKDGTVFAVNSTGFDGTDDSYVSSIEGIFDLIVDDISVDGKPPGKATVRELARLGLWLKQWCSICRYPFFGGAYRATTFLADQASPERSVWLVWRETDDPCRMLASTKGLFRRRFQNETLLGQPLPKPRPIASPTPTPTPLCACGPEG